MKRFSLRSPLLLGLLVSVCLAVGACGSSGPGASTSPTSSTTATAATAKHQPTSVPVASVAKCGQLLSLSEANQDTQPVNPATIIVPLEVSNSALCNYLTSQHQTNVSMIFKSYTGGSLAQNVQQADSSSASKVTIISSQTVSGVGDQAFYVTTIGSSIVSGVAVPVKENILFVVAGAVSFGIINVIYNNVDPLGSASAATVLNNFKQVAQLVISRL